MKQLLLSALLVLAALPLAHAALTCNIEASTTCTNSTKLLGLENDTGGSTNAHAQTYNYTGTTYAHSLCCSTNITGSVGNACTGDTFARLDSQDNAHLQAANESGYAVDACISHTNSDVTCNAVNGSCTASQTCLLSLSSWDNAHAGACGDYDISVCCQELNGPPPTPTLLTPTDGNTSVFERQTEFNWTTVTDPQSDPVTYQINISAPAGCTSIPVVNTSASNYTSTDELCVDNSYNWTVRACDDKDACSAWASTFNFTIASVVGLEFTDNNTNFGELAASTASNNVTNNTLNNDPAPLVVNNTGNVRINVSVRGLDALWTNQPLNTSYLQYADQDSSSWTNVETGNQSYTTDLLYAVTRELEIRVQVPINEPPGPKSATLQATGVSNE